ncbi:MAG: S16 family serine protease [Nitrospirales bacterium]
MSWPSHSEAASGFDAPPVHKRTAIPILGTTMNDAQESIGIVAEIQLDFLQRRDHDGLDIQFHTTPGEFSPYAQQAVIEALYRVVEAAALSPDSWTIRFSLPYPGVTLYGESLSAMAALTIVALAKNEPVDPETVMTGTVTADGHVGTVGGVPLKILAAYEQHYRKVLIPEEPDIADDDWETPFLMDVQPVGSISKAYLALTNRPLRTSFVKHSLAAGLMP